MFVQNKSLPTRINSITKHFVQVKKRVSVKFRKDSHIILQYEEDVDTHRGKVLN